MVPAPALVERFAADLDALIDANARLGIAVSGGPDSVALLLLAAAARPGVVEAATVDHGLRPGSQAEAQAVAEVSEKLGIPHTILEIEWDEPPSGALQEQARQVRYRALAEWMRARDLDALLTAHHVDDQAETLMMRLNRGAGVRGLAGMRRSGPVPFGDQGQALLRPLLGWRRSELEAVCLDAAVTPVQDPSNLDERFERVRMRRALADAGWLDPDAVSRSAGNLAAADEALDWAAAQEWNARVTCRDDGIAYRPSDAPAEIRRRITARALRLLGHEGGEEEMRGRELDRMIDELGTGRTATLRGVKCSGGPEWRFTKSLPRSR